MMNEVKRMKKVLLFIVMMIFIVGCQQHQTPVSLSQEERKEETMSILKVEGENINIRVQMEDNMAAQDLLSRLPMEVQFEDYNQTEKIYYLDKELDTSEAPMSCTPDKGTLACYVPWGNICFFYQDFRTSQGLVPLGKVIEGMEDLDKLDQVHHITLSLES